MITTFLAYQAATGISSMQWLGVGALAGASSSFILTLLFNTTSTTTADNENTTSYLIQETKEQKTHLQSNAEALLDSTHRLHQRLHQQVKDTEQALDEYAQMRQAVFQSLRERQALEKNVISILELFKTEESHLLKNISELTAIKIQQPHNILLLQKYIPSLLQCIEEQDLLIEALQGTYPQHAQLSI